MDIQSTINCLVFRHFNYANYLHKNDILANASKQKPVLYLDSIKETYFTPFIEPIYLVKLLLKHASDLKNLGNEDINAFPDLQNKIDKWLSITKQDIDKSNIFTQHTLHPYLKLLLKYTPSLLEKAQGYLKVERLTYQDFLKQFYILFTQVLVEEIRTKHFKNELSLFNTIAKKNYNSLHHYTNQLLTYYPNLIVIHLDLHYNLGSDWYFPSKLATNNYHQSSVKFSFIPKLDLKFFIPIYPLSKLLKEHYLTYNRAKEHRALFFKQIKKQAFGKYLVGYAWKMDHNNLKGYFYHFLLFFDTTIMPNTLINQLPNLLGNYWRTSITHGWGLGTVNRIKTMSLTDNKKLQTIIAMMTLSDGYLYFTPPNKQDRTFDRGRISPKKIATLTEQAKEQANHWQDL